MCTNELIGQLFTVFLVLSLGTAFGLLLEPDQNLPYPYQYGSAVIGWTYFFAWSISFYPQILHNYNRKTSSGLSVDFLLFNMVGYFCYSVFTVSMYYIPDFRYAYERRHEGNIIQVSISDVCFSIHALLLTVITWGQVIYYDGHHQIPSQCAFLTGFLFFVVCAVYILFITQDLNGGRDPWNWYTFIYFVSMTKLVATLVKYPPQIMANYELKSTVGFSINQVLLDLSGSCLSLTQLVLDCYFSGEDWSGIMGNPVKIGLSCISLTYDAILLYQHYCLYPSRRMIPPPDFSSEMSMVNSLAAATISHGPETTYYTSIQNAIDNRSSAHGHNVYTDDDYSDDDERETNIEMQRREIRRDQQRVANWNSNSSTHSNASLNSLSKYNYTLPPIYKQKQLQQLQQHQQLTDNEDENE